MNNDIVTNDGFSIFGSSIQPLNVRAPKAPESYSYSKVHGFEMLEPTPIGTKGINVVSSFPLNGKNSFPLSSHLSQAMVGDIITPKPSAVNGLHGYQEASLPVETKSGITVETTSSSPFMNGPEPKACILADKWNKRFQELVAFRNKHGHCLVPFQKSEYTELSNWVKRQRNQYRRKMEGKTHTLSAQRQHDLESIGFVWDSRTTGWKKRYEELIQFWLEHGHSKVPKNYKKNPALAIWVKHQRRQYKRRMAGNGKASCISDDRIRQLNALDFDFAPQLR